VVDDSETEDDSDGPAKKAPSIKMSTTESLSATSNSASSSKQNAPSVQSGPLGSLPDRAQMEAERLARRKRTLEDDETSGESKRPRLAGNSVTSTPQTPLASRMFYDGAFFPTATLHANPRADGREAIRFQDILGTASELTLAILSSFTCDPEWLQSHFAAAVPIILVAGTGDEESNASLRKISGNRVQTCPRLGKGGCMHMKVSIVSAFHSRKFDGCSIWLCFINQVVFGSSSALQIYSRSIGRTWRMWVLLYWPHGKYKD
jgi:hypothetical protein